MGSELFRYGILNAALPHNMSTQIDLIENNYNNHRK